MYKTSRMDLEDGVIGLVHGLPSSGLAVTLMGSLPTRNHRASRSTSTGNKNTKIPVRVKSYFPHNETKKSEKQIVKINEECLKKLTNMNCKHLKSVRERIALYHHKVCPKIRERLDKHQKQHHPNNKSTHTCEHYHDVKTLQEPVALSPITSQKNLSISHTSEQYPHAIKSVPTHDNTELENKSNNISITETNISLKVNNTYEVLPNLCVYKEELQEEILKWMKNVPVHSSQSPAAKVEKSINSLTEGLYNLKTEVNDPDYETKVKIEIESILHYIKCPVIENEQDKNKENLFNNLLEKLRDLNDKYLVNSTENNGVRQLCTNLMNLEENKLVSVEMDLNDVRPGVYTQYDINDDIETDTDIQNIFQGINNFTESKSSDMSHVVQSVKDVIIQDGLNYDSDNKSRHVNICYLPPNIRILKIRQGKFGIYSRLDEDKLAREMFKIEELTDDKHVQCDSKYNCESVHSAPLVYSFVQKKGKTSGHKLPQCKCDCKNKHASVGKCDCTINKLSKCECRKTHDKCVCNDKHICNCVCSKDGQCTCDENKNVVKTSANQGATSESQSPLADPKTLQPVINSNTGTQRIESDGDPDRTLKEVITDFIRHKDDVDDHIAMRAYDQLLETEVTNLIFTEGMRPSNSLAKTLPPERLSRELNYVKIISDWLKTIPIEPSFNNVGNKQRVEFINNFAKDMLDNEERTASNDNSLMALVYDYMKKLPVLPQNADDVPYMVNRLLHKVKTLPPNNETSYLSSDSSGLHEQNLSDFLDEFVRIHGGDIGNDEVKLEAWVTRLLQEIKKIAHNSSKPLRKGEVYGQLVKTPTPGNETLRRFSLELGYAKEISQWLQNLPLLPISNKEDRNSIARMVDNMAHRMTEVERKKAANPNDNQAITEFKEYIAKWVSELPIEKNHEIAISIVVSQIINRMERVNKEKLTNDSSVNKTTKKQRESLKFKKGSKTKLKKEQSHPKPPNNRRSSKSKSKSHTTVISPGNDNSKPGQKLVEIVDQWSNKLDVKASDPEESKRIKDTIARKIYKKISELNANPVMDDDIIYKEVLADELDIQLQHLNDGRDDQNKKDKMKTELVEKIMDINRSIKERAAGDNYKRNLVSTIDISMPNPIQVYEKTEPGFQIYKNCLAAIFILENYDHSDEPIKMKYEKAIKKEIDKFFENAQNRNALPLTKEHIYNELYSALYAVPVPDDTTIQEQVEEVKTKGELNIWFEELPLLEACDYEEDLKRDQILDTLAKRLHEMENNNDTDDKIHKEITKWLTKLQYLPGHEANIDQYADNLQSRLKSSVEARRCPAIANYNLKEKANEKLFVENTMNDTVVSRVGYVEPDNARNDLQSPSRNTSESRSASYKKPVDIMEEVIEEWCHELPLLAKTPQEVLSTRELKQRLVTKIITVVSELNANTTALYNNAIYEDLLNKQLEKLLSDLPSCCEMRKTKEKRKLTLIQALTAIKSSLKREILRQEYKNDLNQIVDKMLARQSVKPDKIELFEGIKDKIVDGFIEYTYNKNDIESQLLPKMQIHNAIIKFLTNVKEVESENPLIKRNQLINELAKVKDPGDLILRDEVLEVRMKKKVEELLNDISFNEKVEEKRENFSSRLNQTREVLAKRLKDIETAGHNPATHEQMKSEVTKSLRKIGLEVSCDKIDAFIEKLENDEAVRKTPPKSPEFKQSQRHRSSSPSTNRTVRESEFRTRAPLNSSIQRPQQTWPSSGGLEVPRQRELQWISDIPNSPPRPAYPRRLSSPHPGINSSTPFSYLGDKGTQKPYQNQFEQGHTSNRRNGTSNSQSPRAAHNTHYSNQLNAEQIAPEFSSQGLRYGSRSLSPGTSRRSSPNRQQEEAESSRQNAKRPEGDPQIDEVYSDDKCKFCNSRRFQERDYCNACKDIYKFPFMPPSHCFSYV